jgi:Na+/H+ antiporter NhaA
MSVMPLVRLLLGGLIALCAMYVAFKFTASAFGIGWAIPVGGVVFALTAMALDRAWR